MTRGEFSSKLFRHVCLWVLFWVAAAASFNGYYSKWHFRESGVFGASETTTYRFGIADMLDGTAERPFVYRQLLPALANWLDRKVPISIKDRLYSVGTNQRPTIDVLVDSPLAKDKVYFFRYLVVYAATFLFAWLSVFAMYLVCRALAFPSLTCVFAPVLMILLIPYFMSGGGFFYDYPELAFLALAVWMGLKFDWWWLLPLVALASWDKESFLLVTFTLYPILRTRHTRVGAFIGTSLLAFTSAAVYYAVRSHYLHNPGSAVLVQWIYQVGFFLRPANLIDVEKTYGIMTFRPFSLLPLALIVWTARRGWNRLPLPIRRHGQIAAAINIPLFFLFCMPGEARDLSMLYIVFMLLLAANLTKEVERSNSSTLVRAARVA